MPVMRSRWSSPSGSPSPRDADTPANRRAGHVGETGAAGRGPRAAGSGAIAERRAPRPARAAAVPRPGLHRGRRLRRSGQLRDQRRGRREVRLPAPVGDHRRQPDGDAHPVDERQARHRNRQEPARAVPRAVREAHRVRALAAGRGDRDGDGHRRVRRRCGGSQPAVRHPALHRGADHRRRGLRHPGAAVARLPRARGCHRGSRRRDRGRLRLPGVVRRSVRRGCGPRPDPGLRRRRRRCCSRPASSARP